MNLYEISNTEGVVSDQDDLLETHLEVLNENVFRILGKLKPLVTKDYGWFKQPPENMTSSLAAIMTWMAAQEYRANPSELAVFYSDDDEKMYDIVYKFANRFPDLFQEQKQKITQALKNKSISQLFTTIEQFFDKRTASGKPGEGEPERREQQPTLDGKVQPIPMMQNALG